MTFTTLALKITKYTEMQIRGERKGDRDAKKLNSKREIASLM